MSTKFSSFSPYTELTLNTFSFLFVGIFKQFYNLCSCKFPL
ncbi:hypothetical protein LEP1GSC188_2920 [Leptospira weilii serovar Topaz str. LT2116]|uniref:Uncharacterized protein n=1 Tax=Leptospira weilii serovar Topaz str. LT2116 TaxID=1088540 RepID=M3H2M8_9LEPT|nr:hypothetical protein LEP1GSC188_2920 [Leptospira weilii serovar Topaz str. LT2116]